MSPPPRSRGTIALLAENCTVCMLCARECPDWCITIESHTEPLPPLGPRGRCDGRRAARHLSGAAERAAQSRR